MDLLALVSCALDLLDPIFCIVLSSLSKTVRNGLRLDWIVCVIIFFKKKSPLFCLEMTMLVQQTKRLISVEGRWASQLCM